MNDIQLGQSGRLVFPRQGYPGGPITFTKEGGVWRRDGMQIPDSVRALAHIRNEGWTNDEEQDILENWFAGTALPTTPTHIGLFTTTPADDATGGTEVTGGSYVRDAFAKNGTNWGSSTAGAPSTIQNLIVVTFVTATADWGLIKSWGYFTAVTAGTLRFFATLDTAKTVNNGDTANFAAGTLIGQLGNPADTF